MYLVSAGSSLYSTKIKLIQSIQMLSKDINKMSTSTLANLAPPKTPVELWTILFKTVYENGLLSANACELLQMPPKGIPYSKNGHFQVADITMKKLKALDYTRFPNLPGEMIFAMLGMLGPSAYEPDLIQRKRWANQFISFLQNMVVRLPGKVVMGGTLNDLLVLYFEKLSRKFTSKKTLSGPEGIERFHAIRVACGQAAAEKALATEAIAEAIMEPKIEEINEIPFEIPEEVPDNWDE